MAMHSEPGVYPTSRVPGLGAAGPILDPLAQPSAGSGPDTTILCWNLTAADPYGFCTIEPLSQPIHRLPPQVSIPRNSTINFNSSTATLAGAFSLTDR
jgi:hypothetical protein